MCERLYAGSESARITSYNVCYTKLLRNRKFGNIVAVALVKRCYVFTLGCDHHFKRETAGIGTEGYKTADFINNTHFCMYFRIDDVMNLPAAVATVIFMVTLQKEQFVTRHDRKCKDLGMGVFLSCPCIDTVA